MSTGSLSPDSAAILAARGAGFPPEALTDPAASAAYLSSLRTAAAAAASAPKDEVASVVDLTVRQGLPVRVYRPRTQAPDAPIVVYLHGGGWVLGDLAMHDPLCRILADLSGAVVVNVDYCLAPEHPFPLPLDDVRAAAQWAQDRAPEFGADPAKVVLMGSSSGGNLAAGAALLASRSTDLEIALLVLVYPPLDPALETPSFEEFAEGFLLERDQMRWFWEQYVPDARDRRTPLAAPGLAPDAAAFPPTVVLTAACDPLRDEGERFAARLAAAGRLVEHRRYDGQIHGFLGMPDVLVASRRALGDLAADLRRL